MKEKSLEQYLKELRHSCGYSQEFVASHLNITRQTYSHYETGRINPPSNSLYNLAKLYGVSVNNFLELSVTYQINMDFAITNQAGNADSPEELTQFLDYINEESKERKFKFLDTREKRLLYYFQLLDERDKEDILEFLKVKHKSRYKK